MPMRFKLPATLFLALALLFLLRPAPSEAKEKITIGLLPEMNVFKQMKRFTPLAEYLGQKLEQPVELVMLSRYGNIIERLEKQQIDAAFLGSFTGALAISQLGVEPLARPVNLDGNSTYWGILFVKKGSGITGVKEMRHKTMAFVERATTAGYLFPLAYLKREGVSDIATFFKTSYFTGSHDSAINAVLKGQADIGAAKNSIYDREVQAHPEIAEQLEILARSPQVPSNGLCVRPTMNPGLKQRLKAELLSLPDTAAGRQVLDTLGAKSFVPTSKEDYQPVLDMATEAGLDLAKYQYRNP